MVVTNNEEKKLESWNHSGGFWMFTNIWILKSIWRKKICCDNSGKHLISCFYNWKGFLYKPWMRMKIPLIFRIVCIKKILYKLLDVTYFTKSLYFTVIQDNWIKPIHWYYECNFFYTDFIIKWWLFRLKYAITDWVGDKKAPFVSLEAQNWEARSTRTKT